MLCIARTVADRQTDEQTSRHSIVLAMEHGYVSRGKIVIFDQYLASPQGDREWCLRQASKYNFCLLLLL